MKYKYRIKTVNYEDDRSIYFVEYKWLCFGWFMAYSGFYGGFYNTKKEAVKRVKALKDYHSKQKVTYDYM